VYEKEIGSIQYDPRQKCTLEATEVQGRQGRGMRNATDEEMKKKSQEEPWPRYIRAYAASKSRTRREGEKRESRVA
jgi:hypothetical protein